MFNWSAIHNKSSVYAATADWFDKNQWRFTAHRERIKVLSVGSDSPDHDLMMLKHLRANLVRVSYTLVSPVDYTRTYEYFKRVKGSRRLTVAVEEESLSEFAATKNLRFDLIVMSNNLHLYPDWREVLQQAKELLRVGGTILIMGMGNGAIQSVHDSVLVEGHGVKKERYCTFEVAAEHILDDKTWHVTCNEEGESGHINVNDICGDAEVLASSMLCSVDSLPSDAIKELKAGLLDKSDDGLIEIPLSFLVCTPAFEEVDITTGEEREWWDEDGNFHNRGLARWQETTKAWRIAIQPRPPLPPSVPYDLVLDGISTRDRQFTLPGVMRLPALIELYLELWEADDSW